MIDQDGILRPDNPHAHIVKNKIPCIDKEISPDYSFVNENFLFRIWARLLRRVTIAFLGPWIKYRYRLEIKGKENIKKVRNQGVVVTINHVHNFDNLLVGTKILSHRKCFFITLKDNINTPFIGFFLKTLGGVPIPTKPKALNSFEKAINKILQEKNALLVCPEASLWPFYRGIRPFKKGAFRFAVNNNVSILPIVITFRGKKEKGAFALRHYFTAHVGCPLNEDLDIKNKAQRIIDLQNRTYNFYLKTVENFYKEKQDPN